MNRGAFCGRGWRSVVLIGAAILSAAWFWRFQIVGGFTHGFGDPYDAMIEVSVLQHWDNVLLGREAWNATAYFAPAPDTLGYNDGYLVSGLIYTVWRWLGLPMTVAAEAMHATFKLAGFFGMYLLLSRCCRTRFGWSVWGAVLFTIADMTLQHAHHGQFFALALVPFVALFGWQAVLACVQGQRAPLLRWGLAFAAGFAALAMTSFYLAWFLGLFTIALAAIAAAAGRRHWRDVAHTVRRQWLPLLAIALAGVVLLLPMLCVYLPKARETGMHGFAYLRPSILWPVELVNVGPGNAVWSWLVSAMRSGIAPGLRTNRDLVFGMPPLFLALAVLAVLRAQRIGSPRAIAWIGLALLVGWLLMLDFGGALMPWRVVYAVVPGAGTIRIVGRFALLLLVPAVMLLTVFLDRMRHAQIAVLLAGLLLIEQTATSAPVDLDHREQAAMIAGIPAPPASCRIVAVRSARSQYRAIYPEYDALYAHNVDAMVLAELFARPTINGVATFAPPGWDFADPNRGDYWRRVAAYATRHRLSGLCALDIQRGVIWAPLPR